MNVGLLRYQFPAEYAAPYVKTKFPGEKHMEALE
jgi:hypothetical protein